MKISRDGREIFLPAFPETSPYSARTSLTSTYVAEFPTTDRQPPSLEGTPEIIRNYSGGGTFPGLGQIARKTEITVLDSAAHRIGADSGPALDDAPPGPPVPSGTGTRPGASARPVFPGRGAHDAEQARAGGQSRRADWQAGQVPQNTTSASSTA